MVRRSPGKTPSPDSLLLQELVQLQSAAGANSESRSPSASADETGTTLSNLERPLQMKCLFERSPGAILMGSRCRK